MHKIVKLGADILNYNPVLETDEVDKLLDKVIPYTGGRYNKEDIKEALHADQMQLWLAFDAVNEKDDNDTDTVKIRQGRFDCKFLYYTTK